METNFLSAQYLNQAYVPFSSASSPAASSAIQASQPEGEGTFAEILKKSAEAAKAGGASSPASTKAPIDENDKLYELCMELETFLIKNLIKSMRSTVQKTGLVDTGFAGEVYEDMLYDEYAKAYTKSANFGFAAMAYKELSGEAG